MDKDTYYCCWCDIELRKEELIDGCCPYCNTEIPEAVEQHDDEKEHQS
jgi:hypothetical protein